MQNFSDLVTQSVIAYFSGETLQMLVMKQLTQAFHVLNYVLHLRIHTLCPYVLHLYIFVLMYYIMHGLMYVKYHI